MHGRSADSDNIIRANGHGSFQNAEIVVLLDEYSASSSEIFAGAIQDNDRGLVVGRRSFGKVLSSVSSRWPTAARYVSLLRVITPLGPMHPETLHQRRCRKLRA